MRCDQCHESPGTSYAFYYGKAHRTNRAGNRTSVETGGSQLQQSFVTLCPQCVMEYEYQRLKKRSWVRLAWLAVLLPLIGYLFVAYFQMPERDAVTGVFGLVIVALLVWGLLSTPMKTRRYWRSDVTHRLETCQNDEAGARIAIELRAADLLQQGYEQMWTPQELAKFWEKAEPLAKPMKPPVQPPAQPPAQTMVPPELSRQK